MNKIITIYELLGLIKDGKAPRKINVDDVIYFYNYKAKDYKSEIDEPFFLFNNYVDIKSELDKTLEILEEYKPTIEKISINGKDIHQLEELGIYEVIEDIESTLNEIIDKIEKESK